MRILAILVVIIVLFTFCAFAEDTGRETGGSTFSSPNGEANGLAEWLNEQEYLDHNHAYLDQDTDTDTVYERENPMGLGADITLWQNDSKTVGVEAQVKHDFNNEETAVFGVVQFNLWETFFKK